MLIDLLFTAGFMI